MAVRKVIQDSDDEGHDDNNSPSRPPIHNSSTDKFTDLHLSSSSSKSLQFHDESSTGSTERLNLDIMEAHKKLLEQTPDSASLKLKLMRSSQQPPTSPEMPHLKSRRATTAFSERKEKKPMKTYGSKASQDTEFYSSSNLAFEYSPRSRLECVNDNKFSQKIGAHGIAEEAQPKIQGCEIASTINIDSEVSEYIGNTNKSQSARSLISPISPLHTSANIGNIQGSHCSIMLPFTEAQNTVQFETTPVVTCDDPDTRSSFDCIASSPFSERSSDEVNNSTILGGERKKSRKRTLSQTDPPPLDFEEQTQQLDQLHQHHAKRVRIEETMAPPTSSGEKSENDTNDELSLSVVIPLPSATKPKPSKSRIAEPNETIPGDEFGSDEISSGLPTERYQPRPSRSRSGLVDDKLLVPVDFSKRPESIAKRKRKNRRKTTAFEHLIYNDEEAEENVPESHPPPQTTIPPPDQDQPQPQNQESTPLHTARSPPKTSQPSTTTIPTAPSPKKRGRPKKQPPPPPPPPPLSPPILSSTQPKQLSPSPQHPSPHPSPSPSPPKPKTPQKPPALKGPDKHSPLSNGKVAYRVGLSRKARIEPLLRVRRR